MKTGSFLTAMLLVLAQAPPAIADGGGGIDRGIQETAPRQPAARVDDYTEAERAVKAREYEKSIAALDRILARQPNNVDALNYLGYSHRELGRYDVALGYYQQALAINPQHRGANEYLGQLFIRMGRTAEARAQLAKLEKLCGRGCEEYESLRAALAKAGRRS